LGENASVNKAKHPIVTTDAEIDSAIAQAKIYDQYRPKATNAAYREADDAFVIEFLSGVVLTVPRRLLQGLENATHAQLTEVEVDHGQAGLHWESIDVDHYIPTVLEGVFGSRKWMTQLGKMGGTSRSTAKQTAARQNGRKGGRPKKSAA
jgi:hypothetical protein